MMIQSATVELHPAILPILAVAIYYTIAFGKNMKLRLAMMATSQITE